MDPLADPLSEFAYAAEAYDAVISAALAAEAAGTDGGDLADFIVAVTSGSVICFSFAECIDLLFRGEDIGYAGVSGPLIMNAQGENVGAVYSVVEFGADNRIDDSLTRLVELQGDTEVSPAVVTEPRRFGDGVLTIGSLLPISGQLFQYAPAQQSAIRLAVADVNEAGGVLGFDVDYVEADSGDTGNNIMDQALDDLLDAEVDVIIGPSSTAVTIRLIDRIIEAGVVQISPANTNMLLSGFEDQGLYFRMAASDDQQALLLADLIAQDGVTRVGVFAVDNIYGNAVADALERSLELLGVTVVLMDRYAPNVGRFDDNVAAMRSAEVDGIVMISFDEGAWLLRSLVEAGLGPEVLPVYGTDSIMGDAFGELFDAAR
jgi:ABC-type branched-subunit amino acid transport system substrate-binding protein